MEPLRSILEAALREAASDIHLKSGASPVFRIDGELRRTDGPELSESEIERMIEVLLPPAQRAAFARHNEADASFVTETGSRFRVNVFRQRGRAGVALRHVRPQVPGFEELGLPIGFMEAAAARSTGLILISGTTGSGKSTTLAALLDRINATAASHIVTIEDPIEFVFEDRLSVVEQREIGLDTENYPAALRQVMRQDPDVIVIGEMRDAASFRAGISAADTGHLVLATLHAFNVRQTVDRALDFFEPGERAQVRRQLGSALSCIFCQRLVPAIGGGVLPVLEVLVSTETVRKLFRNDRLDELGAAIAQAGSEGMQSFDQALLSMVQDGKISRETALAHASNPEQLNMNFRGIFASERRILG